MCYIVLAEMTGEVDRDVPWSMRPPNKFHRSSKEQKPLSHLHCIHLQHKGEIQEQYLGIEAWKTEKYDNISTMEHLNCRGWLIPIHIKIWLSWMINFMQSVKVETKYNKLCLSYQI